MDKAKLLFQARKLQKTQKQLEKNILEIEGGDGAVVIEINGFQKIKKIHIDPDRVDLENIDELEKWLEDALRESVEQSQKLMAETLKPFAPLIGQINDMGLNL